jgi:hypothetical protein
MDEHAADASWMLQARSLVMCSAQLSHCSPNAANKLSAGLKLALESVA